MEGTVQLPYCMLRDAGFEAVGGRSLLGAASISLRQVLSASRRIDELRFGSLFDIRTETFRSHGNYFRDFGVASTQWWALATELSKVLSLTADSADIDVGDVSLRWRQFGLATIVNPPIVVRGEWGPGVRGASITPGTAVGAGDTTIETPTDAPDWWTVGSVFVIDSEIFLIAAVDGTTWAVTRSGADAHDDTATWQHIESPPHLQDAAIGMARRLAWQQSNVSKAPGWERLEQGFEQLITEEYGRA